MTGNAFLHGNALAFTLIAFSSYFDVYSHAYIFVGIDPWWNPAHLMLYGGFLVLILAIWRSDRSDPSVKLSEVGVATSITAAAFNEFWHRVLLFGNPLPEPFPVEPPHVLLAVGIIASGSAALLYPLRHDVVSDWRSRLAQAATSGSLWLIVAGSAFYVGGAYDTTPALLLAAGVAGFSAALFLRCAAKVSLRFGFASLSYAWFMLVYYIFFLTPADGVPVGLIPVVIVDFLMTSRFGRQYERYAILILTGPFYGLVYTPVISIGVTLSLNLGLAAATLGALSEYGLEWATLGSLEADRKKNFGIEAQPDGSDSTLTRASPRSSSV